MNALREELLAAARAKNRPALLAIDGRCASGKTTLAALLAERWDAGVVHMDDFFLRPEQRSAERFAVPGENIDHERFREEVLLPLSRGEPAAYRRFDCRDFSLSAPIPVPQTPILVIEGSYSCHPELREFYDRRIFLDIDAETQKARLIAREGPERWKDFEERWIPLEEAYFRECAVRECCDLVFGPDDSPDAWDF